MNSDTIARRITWRRISRHPVLMEYRRLVVIAFLANAAAFVTGVRYGWWDDGARYVLPHLANMALANFSVGILIRQQRIINLLFWLATRIPVTWPLWMRWQAGKVFHFGGLHSGANVSGSIWFTFLLWAMIANRLTGDTIPSNRTVMVSAAMVTMMALIVVTALSPVRGRFHNAFEKIHRFGGWTLLGLFWAQLYSISSDANVAATSTAGFWSLSLITLSVASPWLTLRRVDVAIAKPSSHAVLASFDYGKPPFPGSSNAISRSPFGEYHSFANIPSPGRAGYRLAISRSGDWTARFIDNPPAKVWVKGITTSGVARIEVLFRKVVYVGTGSGIGPILPHLLAKDVPCHLIWSTRSPRQTYGDHLVDEIEANTDNPLIWDTDRQGKPDLSRLALEAVARIGAEAVIVISNQKLTRKVVYDLECAGIPAYGAIWDS